MSHVLQVLLLLSLVIAAAKVAGAAAARLGQPAVLGDLLVGLILGPTALDVLSWPAFAEPPIGATISLPLALPALLNDLAELGVILLMLIAGLETDLAQMRKVSAAAFSSAAGGVVLPMLGGILAARAFGLPVFWTGTFIGTILTATSVSVSAEVLMELGVLSSKEGSTILGAAVIDDVLSVLVLSIVVALAEGGAGITSLQLAVIVGRMAVFFAAGIICGRLFGGLLAWGDSLNVRQGLLATVVVVTWLYAWAAEYVGHVAAITGAYLVGVLLARTGFKRRIDEGMHALAYSMLIPVFFVSIGLRANGRALGPYAAFAAVLVLVAIAGKLVGSGVCARLCGFSTLESVRVGVGMISRGEVGLIIAGYGLSHGVITQEVFSASVLVVVVTTVITPPLLRMTYPRRAARTGIL